MNDSIYLNIMSRNNKRLRITNLEFSNYWKVYSILRSLNFVPIDNFSYLIPKDNQVIGVITAGKLNYSIILRPKFSKKINKFIQKRGVFL